VPSVSSHWTCLALVFSIASACNERRSHEITITDGAATTRFSTKSELAEYVELPGDHDELRLTLAGYNASCERWVPPGEGESSLTLVIVTPPNAPPAPGAYEWSGIPKPEDGLHAPYVLPKAHFGPRSRLFEPGGAARLTKVQLDPHGVIAGTLAFEFPGAPDRPATRIDGNFEARLCRLSASPEGPALANRALGG